MESNALFNSGNEPTISDVAELAGVSIRTVSRVLNNSPRVSDDTRDRIQNAIARLNFRPSLRARALAKGQSFLIGIVHNDRNALVLDTVQRGVGREATRRGYEVICHSTPFDGMEAITDVLAFARRSRIDGLIVLPPVSGIAGLPQSLRVEHIPCAAVSAIAIEGYDDVVLSREGDAAGAVARYLMGLGHRRIAMITGPQSMISAIERRRGFSEALAQCNVPLHGEIEGDYGLASGIEAADRLLSMAPPPTAIFAANDIMAAGVLKVASERGIPVPRGLSVVGFDGSLLAEMLTPSLTTVARPFGEMAEIATRHLIAIIENQDMGRLVPPPLTLVEARSTARPPEPPELTS